jgi:hypothetical protein
LAGDRSIADSGREGVKRRGNTFRTALVPCLNELGFPVVPRTDDKADQLLQDLWTIGSCWRSPGPWWGGYSPEKFLGRWAAVLSSRHDLSFDVIGWAFFAAKREAEYKKQRKLLAHDFLTGEKPGTLLSRLTRWAEARLCYYRVGLQLTFYKRDTLARQEPIASNVEWLRERLKHFVAVRIREVKPEPYLNPAHYYLSSELDYLCWLHLVSPISKRWTLHEISKAVKKTFFDDQWYQFKERWWAKPPDKLTYREASENDTLGQRLHKKIVPEEFELAEADWLSGILSNLRSFSDSLAGKLAATNFCYIKRAGRPAKSHTETPTEIARSSLKRREFPESPIEAIAHLAPDLATILQSSVPQAVGLG